MKEIQKAKIRKNNMKLYPIYTMFGLDLVFFYGIEVLFLTQVKGLSDADVVFLSSIFAFFSIFMKIPMNLVMDRIGKKKSLFIRQYMYSTVYCVVNSKSKYVFYNTSVDLWKQ